MLLCQKLCGVQYKWLYAPRLVAALWQCDNVHPPPSTPGRWWWVVRMWGGLCVTRVHTCHRHLCGHHWPHTPGGESWPGNKPLILDCGSQCGGDNNTDRGSDSETTLETWWVPVFECHFHNIQRRLQVVSVNCGVPAPQLIQTPLGNMGQCQGQVSAEYRSQQKLLKW